MIFETIAQTGHEQIVFCHSKDAGLKAIIAVHNTVLGPALGGLRMWPYKNEAEALNDVLRLSRGMTYKNAVAGLNLGGGKAVIIGDPATDKSEALFRAFGRFVNSLNGRYITAEDVGIDVNDMEWVFRETEFVTGVHQVHGGSGDPSPFTAFGTLQGLMAALHHKFGNEDVGKYSYAVQGCGPCRHGVHQAAARARREGVRHRHQQGPRAEGGRRTRLHRGRPRRDLRRRRGRVQPVRTRRHAEREDDRPDQGEDDLRRGEQPARDRCDRRRAQRSAACCTRPTTRSTRAA